jgi:hypothetical protein
MNHRTLTLLIILLLAGVSVTNFTQPSPTPMCEQPTLEEEGKTVCAVIKTEVYIDLFKFFKIRCFYIPVFIKLGIPPLRLVLLPPPEYGAC